MFLTSALDEGEWLASRLGLFTPAQHPMYRRVGETQSLSERSSEVKRRT